MSKPKRTRWARLAEFAPRFAGIALCGMLPLSALGAGRIEEEGGSPEASANEDRAMSTPVPMPIPSPEIDDGVDRPAPSVSGGWLAVVGDPDRAAAELLREWSASAAPALPPVEERLPNGAVKLHHRGHYLSTLCATIDEQGRLQYSHGPPAAAPVEASAEAPESTATGPEGGER